MKKYNKKSIISILTIVFFLVNVLVVPVPKAYAETAISQSAMIALDISSSMKNGGKIENAKKAAINFIDNHKDCEIGIITFNSNGNKTINTPMTTDYEMLKKKITALSTVGTGDNLLRPLKETIEMAKAEVKSKHKSDKGMVFLLTDVESDELSQPKKITDLVKQTQYSIEFNEQGQSIMLLIDASGSMDGSKMDCAKQAAEKLLDNVKGNNMEFGLIVFYSQENIVLESPLTKDFGSVKEKISKIRAEGNTPLAASIKMAGKELVDKSSYNKGRIIIFSDGQENCGGNPVEEAKLLGKVDKKANGELMSITVETIGLQVDEWTKKQLQDIASAGNGSYTDVTNPEDMKKVVEAIDLQAIEVSAEKDKVRPGETLQLIVKGIKKDGTKIDITKDSGTTYVSKNPNCIVNKDGLITVTDGISGGSLINIVISNNKLSTDFYATVDKALKDIVTKVAIVPENVTFKFGEKPIIKVIQIMGDGSEKDVTTDANTKYTVGNASLLKISENGELEALKNEDGVVSLTAENGEFKAQARVTITKDRSNEVTGIEVTPSDVTLKVGQEKQLSAFAIMGDGSKKDITNDVNTTFVSNTDKIQVTSKGLIKIPNNVADTGIIRVKNGNFNAEVNVTIEQDLSKISKAIKVTPKTINLKQGETAQLKVIQVMGDGTEKDVTKDSNIKYISGNINVVSVNNEGIVTAVDNVNGGTASVNVTDGTNSDKVVVTVPQDLSKIVKGIEVSPKDITLKPGEKAELQVLQVMGDGNKKDITKDASTKYSSNNVNLLSVTDKGELQVPVTEAYGDVTVTVENSGYTEKVNVTVPQDMTKVITGIKIQPDETVLNPGEKAKIKLFNIMGDGTEKEITDFTGYKFHSGNESIFTIDENGEITAALNYSGGIASLSVSGDNGRARATVKVNQDLSKIIDKIEVLPKSLTLKQGENASLQVMQVMRDGSKNDITNDEGVIYTSSNKSLVSVDKSGKIQIADGTEYGSANVKVQYGGYYANVSVNVPQDLSKVITGLELLPAESTLKAGEKLQLQVMKVMGDGNKKDITNDVNNVFKSGNSSLVLVDEKTGLVTIPDNVSNGMASVNVINGSYSARAVIVVKPDPAKVISKIDLTPKDITLKAGETAELKLTATMQDGSTKDITNDSNTKYTSGNDSKVTVDSKGKVTVLNDVACGQVSVAATNGSFSSKIIVTIPEDLSKKVTSISIEPRTLTLKTGETYQVKVNAVMGDGSTKDITNDPNTKYGSGNASLMTIGATGLAKIGDNVSSGVVSLIATNDSFKDRIVVEIKPDLSKIVSGIELSLPKTKFMAGEKAKATVYKVMGDGTKNDITDDPNNKFISGNKSLLKVNQDGTIEIPENVTSGIVSYRINNGAYSARVTLEVTQDPAKVVKGIEVIPSNTTVKAGETAQLQVFKVMGDGNKIDITNDSNIKYTSGNTSKLTVSAQGQIQVLPNVSAGTISVSVNYDNYSSSLIITVPQDLSKVTKEIRITPNYIEFKAGETVQLKVEAVMGDGSVKDITNDAKTTYISGNTSYIVISSTGEVKAQNVQNGLASMNVRYDGLAARGTVLIKP